MSKYQTRFTPEDPGRLAQKVSSFSPEGYLTLVMRDEATGVRHGVSVWGGAEVHACEEACALRMPCGGLLTFARDGDLLSVTDPAGNRLHTREVEVVPFEAFGVLPSAHTKAKL